jgi:hypothetical protein
MGRSVTKAHGVLLVACAVAVWASAAKENSTSWAPVQFPSDDEQPAVVRFATTVGDAIIFATDHTDHTVRVDKHLTNDATGGSLQVCDILWCPVLFFLKNV